MNPSIRRITVTTLFPSDRRTFRYPGSLTTPPCSEGVAWHLFKTPFRLRRPRPRLSRALWASTAATCSR
ncbi:MAG: hypothetical protein FJ316_04025 [SAR202 cluster bacterium]|nr:hypothetical protein [SAR202 cluster bacterium]